jgi:ubiquinone/menaquinone biosynthesis C-methylase UbiE
MPFPVAGLDALYTDPDDYFSAHDVEQKKMIGREIMKIAQSKLGRRGAILDVGCGRGELLWAAREAQWEYAGVDASQAHLDWARENLGIEGTLGTLEQANFPSEFFDIVIMGGVIEHLYDPYQTLREVHRVLKPGGLLHFDAPNEDGLYTRIGNLYLRAQGRDWVVNLAPTFPPYHVQGFNPSSVRKLLQRVGLDLDELSITGKVSPATGETSLRKRLEHRAAQLVNWIGRHRGSGIYMYLWAKRPQE